MCALFEGVRCMVTTYVTKQSLFCAVSALSVVILNKFVCIMFMAQV